ncbi:hypothetical protein IW262DRAFT_286300 [Armillaria fumosa]|nr:hypothetical protein IW262DRAFT_286300 [Armillaria fumosa]
MVGSRTKELHLYIPISTFSHLVSLELSFPLLDKLVILSRDISTESHCQLFGDAPKPRVVEVIDVANPSFSFEPPFAQIWHFRSNHVHNIALTVFCRRRPRPSELLDFLGVETGLETCVVELEMGNEDTCITQHRAETYPVSCRRLNSLDVSSLFPKDHATKNAIKQFFNGLILSAVSSIKVTCIIRHQEREEAVFTYLRQLLDRSKPPLTALYFTRGRTLPTTSISYASLLPWKTYVS